MCLQIIRIKEELISYSRVKNSLETAQKMQGSPCDVMAKVLECEIVVYEFELQSQYHFHFWNNTIGKGMNPLILTAIG